MSSSKSPLPRISDSVAPGAGLSETGPFVKGGEHPRGTISPPLYEERGGRGDFLGSSTSVFRIKERIKANPPAYGIPSSH